MSTATDRQIAPSAERPPATPGIRPDSPVTVAGAPVAGAPVAGAPVAGAPVAAPAAGGPSLAPPVTGGVLDAVPASGSDRKAVLFMALWFGLPLMIVILYQLLASGRD